MVWTRPYAMRVVRSSFPTNAKELLEALLSFETQLAKARNHQKTNAAQEQGAHVGGPRLLDDAAVRLATSRAHAGEPDRKIARTSGVSARRPRRALRAEPAS
jgi:hypothetical protein